MGKINITKYKKSLEDSGGIITTIAKNLGVTRQTLYTWLQKYPEMEYFREQEREKVLDMAENSLFSLVQKKDFPATKFLLASFGKKRGYNERPETEVNITSDKIQTIQVNIPEEVKELIEAENGK